MAPAQSGSEKIVSMGCWRRGGREGKGLTRCVEGAGGSVEAQVEALHVSAIPFNSNSSDE